MRRDFRKPLVVVSPKKLLRLTGACSQIEEFREGLRFQRLIPDSSAQGPVKTLIFCSGQLYYDLDSYRKQTNRSDVAIARVEQLSPFPFASVQKEMERFKEAQVVWAQEEPRNQGPWPFARIRFESLFQKLQRQGRAKYAGRDSSASTATGYHKVHEQELQQLLHTAFE
mmetsp:Transcript_18744/g.17878  ORF Transcript_18744/g.17878 Transcript_18744/m.17878 type:complete len:169 (+) Transcript_18744:868-1374(+)